MWLILSAPSPGQLVASRGRDILSFQHIILHGKTHSATVAELITR